MFTKYAKDLLRIAAPIMMGNIGFIMIGVGDVIIAGRHSTDTLAAISIAAAVTHCLLMLGIGILGSISAILSNYRGEGKDIKKYFFPSIRFSMFLAFIASLLIMAFVPLMGKLGFAPNLVPMIKSYMIITALATFGGYLHCAMKEYLQAFEIVVFPNIVTIFSVFLNIVLNILFVFGYGIIPEMGAIGLATASLITRYFMGLVLLAFCFIKFRFQAFKDFNYYKDLIKVGLPASLAIMIEFAGFNIIALVMGRVAGIYAAAHNLICTLTSVSFMIPLAISNATAVKVGYSNGAKLYDDLKKYAYTGISISVGFMVCSAMTIGLLPEFLTGLFTKDAELIKICLPIVYVLCCFQVFDGLQVTLAGIFRGIKNTKIVMLANIIGYWIIAFPLGCTLAFHYHLNLLGFWISLGISAVVLCSIMVISMLKKFKNIEG